MQMEQVVTPVKGVYERSRITAEGDFSKRESIGYTDSFLTSIDPQLPSASLEFRRKGVRFFHRRCVTASLKSRQPALVSGSSAHSADPSKEKTIQHDNHSFQCLAPPRSSEKPPYSRPRFKKTFSSQLETPSFSPSKDSPSQSPSTEKVLAPSNHSVNLVGGYKTNRLRQLIAIRRAHHTVESSSVQRRLETHPWHQLRHLGVSAFNDAPLDSFLPELSILLGGKSTRVSFVDIEGRCFEVKSSFRMSRSCNKIPFFPSQGLVNGKKLNDRRLLIRPLLEEDGADFKTFFLNHQEHTFSRSDRKAESLKGFSRFFNSLRSTQRIDPIASPPDTLSLPNQSNIALPYSTLGNLDAPLSYAGESVTSLGTAGYNWTFGKNVEKWRNYATVAALYMALADSGFCDKEFPFLTVYLMKWGDICQSCDPDIPTLIRSRSNLVLAQNRWNYATNHPDETVPVAVSLPIRRKGIMRVLPKEVSGSSFLGSPPSIFTHPFTDAEVFQLFYLQLVFRAAFDIRFPAMVLSSRDEKTSVVMDYLRSDMVGSRNSGDQEIAFEHPKDKNLWLLFPAYSNVLYFLNLEDAVVPLYSTPEELFITESMPLCGGSISLPCQGRVGRVATDWASKQVIDSPSCAINALVELFDLFSDYYSASRDEILSLSVPSRIFRCSESSAFSSMHTRHGDLSRFLISHDVRAMGESQVPYCFPQYRINSIPDPSKFDETLLPVNADTPKAQMLDSTRTERPEIVHKAIAQSSSKKNITTFVDQFDLARHNDDPSKLTKKTEGGPPLIIPDGAHDTKRSSSRPSGGPTAVESNSSPHQSGKDEDDTMMLEIDEESFLKYSHQIVSGATPASAEVEHVTPHYEGTSLLPIFDRAPCTGPQTPSFSVLRHTAPQEGSTDSHPLHRSSDWGGAAEISTTVIAKPVYPTSQLTRQETLVTRWRQYIHEGSVSLFDGHTEGLGIIKLIGKGGSGYVYKGTYGRHFHPVAIKVFVIPDDMSHEDYVRESLTDVSFFVLFNQLDDFGIAKVARAHDFIISSNLPKGMPMEDALSCTKGKDPAATQLCYLVTDLMDGVLGRFVEPGEDDYDSFFDTIVNSPLRDAELFQFLYMQLILKSLYDYKILDLMLSGQLRGDNIGFRYIKPFLPESTEDIALSSSQKSASMNYKGIIIAYHWSLDEPVRYLRFDAQSSSPDMDASPLRFICFIDLGQGKQPDVEKLTAQRMVGSTVVDSCVEDDGMGRYWPLSELYCKYVDVTGSLAKEVVDWGAKQKVDSPSAAEQSLRELLDLYQPIYGVEKPTEEELTQYAVYTWSPFVANELRAAYVYGD